jgi:hypothetical protein
MGNPFLGVFLHWCGGLASGSFYVPYKGVKKWSWETYWLVGGFFSWIICPWAFAYFMTNDLFGVLKQQSSSTLAWTYFFGMLWGFGGLTYGLTMRFLGLSLGTGVALGYCAAFGTLVPPIFKALTPNFFVFASSASIVEVAKSNSGKVTLAGVGICLLGIAIAALAGFTKEQEMPAEQKQKSIKEFSFKKGIAVATFCGIMSACFAFALQSGKSINVASLKAGYIHGAAEAGIHVAESPEIPTANLDQFAAGLDAASFGLNADKKLDFAGIIADVETNSAFAAKIIATYSKSTDEVGQRVATYASSFAAVSTNAASTIKGLGDFSEKELAVNIASAGGDIASMHKRYSIWTGLPALPVLLLGGFTTNFIWCVLLNFKNRSGYQYLASHVKAEHAHHGGTGSGEHGPADVAAGGSVTDLKIPVLGNYLFSALAGTTWYFQFFFYTMGATQMVPYDFASWTLHMSSIIIFATMWGWIFHEWKGSSKKAHLLIAGGIATLVLSTVVIGLGTAMSGGKPFHQIINMLLGRS